jgi:hypothetical protein
LLPDVLFVEHPPTISRNDTAIVVDISFCIFST